MKINSVNGKAIVKKLNNYLKSDDIQKKFEHETSVILVSRHRAGITDANNDPINATTKEFIEILKDNIYESGMSDNAADSLSDIREGGLKYLGNNRYSINVWFENVTRPSLNPDKRLDSLADLFNYGVDGEISTRVWGWWKPHNTGKKIHIGNRTIFPRLDFYDQTISEFNEAYPHAKAKKN